MLDGLFGSKFANKCKHSVKYIRARLDPIRKKKEAVVWYLKRDVAELLSHGHDLNAFSRMETLIVEMNHESCYNMIEQYCEDILNQLKLLEKQRECPDEAKEAIATLIFAAARFPDLRELCEIRQIFTQKFGCQMESFVNSEFMKNTQEKTFSDERKIRVMQNIALEFSIGFDSKALKWKLANPSQAKYDEPKKPAPPRHEESYLKMPNSHHESKPTPEIQAELKELRSKPKELRAEPKELRSKPKESRTEPKVMRSKPKELQAEPKVIWDEPKESRSKLKEFRAEPKVIWDEPKESRAQKKELKVVLDGPKEFWAEPKELRTEPKDIHVIPKKPEPRGLDGTPKKNHYREITKDDRLKEAPYSFNEEKPGLGSVQSLAEKGHGNVGGPVLDRLQVKDNGSDFLRPDPKGKASKIVPPPYTKPKTPRVGKYTEEEIGDSDPYLADKQHIRPVSGDRPTNLAPPYIKPSFKVQPTDNEKPRPVSVRSKVPKPLILSETNPSETALYDEELMARSQSTKKKHRPKYQDDDHKYDDVNYAKEFRKPSGRSSSSKSRHRIHDEQEEEDNVIDYGNLLRGPSRGHSRRHRERRAYEGERDEEERVMDKLLMHYSRKGLSGADIEPVKERSEPVEERSRARLPPPAPSMTRPTVDQAHHGPGRAVSLPTDPVRGEEETIRVPVRAASLQPDPFNPNGARVHPNLPDFDELAARIQALRKA